MATSRNSLIPSTVIPGYRTFRDEDNDKQRHCSKKKDRSSNTGFINFWIRLWSCLVVKTTLAILVTFIIAYCEDTGFHYEELDQDAGTDNCSVKIRKSDTSMFEDLVVDRNEDVMYVRLETSTNVSASEYTSIYQPQEWIWTHGDSAILVWPESYELWSFGILDLHTKRNVSIQLELSPPGCEFTWGEPHTTHTVGRALLNLTKAMFEKQKNLKRSKWCYTVRLRNITRNPVLEQDFSFFVQDIGYKCCTFHRDRNDELVPKCDNDVIVERLWTNVPFIFAFVTLLISPNIMVFIYQFLSFKSHVYWIHNKDQSNSDYASSADEWLYTDYKSPITFLSFLRDFTRMYQGSRSKQTSKTAKVDVVYSSCICSDFCLIHLKRFLKYVSLAVTLVVLSLSVILLSLLMYKIDHTSYNQLEQEIKNDIPIGFLSLLFPYEENHDNFMFHIGGPYVFVSIYCCFAFGYILVYGLSKPVDGEDDYNKGNFALNLDLVEIYGRIRCSVNKRYGIFETIHANSRAIFRGGFWQELLTRLVFGNGQLCLSRGSDECCRKMLNILKLPILFFSIVFSFSVHLIPFLFASLFILIDCIRRTRRNHPLDLLKIFLLSGVHLCLVFSFTIIFFGSAEFVFLMLSFCVLAMVLFPGPASGIFIFGLVGVYYILERFRGIAKKYATYRDLAISVSQSLCDKCKGVEARVSEDKTTLLIAGVIMRDIKYIDVITDKIKDADDNIFRGKKQGSLHCHLRDKTLKISGAVDVSQLETVRVSGIPLRIVNRRQTEMVGEHLHTLLCVEAECGQMQVTVLDVRNASRKSEDPGIVVTVPDDDPCYVTYRNGLPGIPWALMDTIVKEYLPASSERLQAVIWTVLVSCVIAWLSVIIRRFNQWEQMASIINALMVVILVKLSDVVRVFSVDVSETQKKDILKSQLRLTVQEYWVKREYDQYLPDDTEAPSTSSSNTVGSSASAV